jgi:hypothetical protein
VPLATEQRCSGAAGAQPVALSAQFAHDAPVDADSETDVIKQMRLRAEVRLGAARGFLHSNPLVGLTVDEARLRAQKAGVPFRAVDVAQPILSADMRPGRVTAMVEDGVVVSAEVGN